jgi:DNA repair protein RecO
MLIISGLAIVLKRTTHKESDVKLFLFFREQGKLMAISKSAQKAMSKLKSLHEPFTLGDLQVSLPVHGFQGRLIGGQLIQTHEPLRSRWRNMEMAFRCSEALDLLLPFRAPSPDVFDILRQTLRDLSFSSEPEIEWIQFIIRLLQVLGHGDIKDRLSSQFKEKEWESICHKLERPAGEDENIVSPETIQKLSFIAESELLIHLPRPLSARLDWSDELVKKG